MTPTRQDVLFAKTRHKGCKGKVDSGPGSIVWKCPDCGNTWHYETIKKLTEAQLEDRFELISGPPAAPESLVLVWQVDPVTKRRHATAIPKSEASGLERVLFD